MNEPLNNSRFSPYLLLVGAGFLLWIYLGYLASQPGSQAGVTTVPGFYRGYLRADPEADFAVVRSAGEIELFRIYLGDRYVFDGDRLGIITVRPRGNVSFHGLWAPTIERRDSSYRMSEFRPIVDDERLIIRSRLAEALAAATGAPSSDPYLQAIARGENSSERRLLMGYAHNIITLLWIGVLGWLVRRCWRTLKYHSELARLAAGVCPYCKYSLDGLTRGRCPECGRVWSA